MVGDTYNKGWMKYFGALMIACVAVRAAGPPPVEDLVRQGFEDFYNLDYPQAIDNFEKAIALDSSDPELHNHLAQALLYGELYRDGALDSQLVTGNNSFVRRARMEPPPGLERRFLGEVDRAIHLCQQQLATNSRNTRALHAQAVAYGLRANWGFLVRKTWMASLSDSSKAHKYDEQVTALDPTNYDARLVQGIYDYIVGSLPWSMRALGFVAGFRGDKARGIATIEEVTRKGRDNRIDAEIILCALYRREGQSQRAIPLVRQLIDRFPRNYLLRFELAQMDAAAGHRKDALQTLAEIAKLKQENAPGYGRIPQEKIYYETGNLQFWFDDLEDALKNLQKVTSTADQLQQLDLNTGVLALMRQGQIYDLRRRHDLATKAYQQAIQLAPDAEAARESEHYIRNPYKRS
jgi:tetratricopeptide (TPR) repeat protein